MHSFEPVTSGLSWWLVAATAAFVLGPAAVLPAQPATDRGRLEAAIRTALEQEDWESAVDAGRKLVELSPEEPGPAYNLACALALRGDTAEAVAWLTKAAERGFSYASTLLLDEDLDSIRNHPGYAQALAYVRRNNAAELETFAKKYSKQKVLTILPPGYDPAKPAPLIVALHGRGADAANIAVTWREAAAEIGAILIAPQAVTKRGGGYDWGVVEQGEWLVLDAISRTRAAYNIDEQKVVLTGFSQGGAMTFLIGLRHPGAFAGLIPVAGHFEDRITPIPSNPEAASALPRVYIMNGEKDDAADNNREAAKRFEAAGVPCVVKIYPNLGHSFPPDRMDETRAALGFVLE